MRLVLLGDIHVYRLGLAPWDMLSKRILGQSNLWLNRRKRFDHDLLPGLIRQAIDLKPDLALLSGDLTTTSLKGEFELAGRLLEPLTGKVPAVLVPGNHDRYTYTAARTKRIDRMLSELMPSAFPHTQVLNDRWRLLALDAASPHPYNARGRLGPGQLERAVEHIASLEAGEGLVVLCHYPCVVPKGVHELPSHAMRERAALREALERCKARVVYLHGHIHKPWHHEPGDGSGVPFTCIDAGAPCLVSKAYPTGQGFYEIDLPDDPAGRVVVRHHKPGTD